MDRIVVDEHYQNMKIGSKLYAHLEAEMKREQIKLICAEVNTDNTGSMRFHQRLGFKVTKKGHEHEPGYVVNFMIKEVASGA